MHLALIHPGEPPERLLAGLAVALAVLRREEVYLLTAWRALAAEQAWRESGWDSRLALSDKQMAAVLVFRLAEVEVNKVLGRPLLGDDRVVLDFIES